MSTTNSQAIEMEKREEDIRVAEQPQTYDYDSGLQVVSGPQWKSNLGRTMSMNGPQTAYSLLPETDWTKQNARFQVEHSDKEIQHQEEPPKRTICGIRRKLFLWVSFMVTAIVIIAVALGVGLATGLRKHDDDRTDDIDTSATNGPQLQIRDKSGVAMTSPPGQDVLYAYYTDAAGRFLEGKYEGGSWDQNNMVAEQAKITTAIRSAPEPGTLLAAVSYTRDNTPVRQLFFLDTVGVIRSINNTGSGWDEPYRIMSDQSSLPQSQALAACADTNVNGFGASIPELAYDFEESVVDWRVETIFNGSDPRAGVACTVSSSASNLYLRNSTTNALQQLTYNFTSKTWDPGASSDSSCPVESRGSIAAATDGQSTDYIFYRSNNKTVQAFFSPGQNITETQSDIESLNYATVGYRLTAGWATNSQGRMSAVCVNQRPEAQDLFFTSVARDGGWVESYTETGR
ncbi:hypothetical protein Slin15195_G091600 [Septoria linicola]|uniref:Fucose-specific lectin n=1 Tax=Septoria linicola TaxID=215465 RepID=A0A9Q9B3W6_9PEZI|nr:hypothetical protein Slin15195_G091600 [Septoria linicola]